MDTSTITTIRSISWPISLDRKVEKQAKKTGLSVSAITRRAVAIYLDNLAGKPAVACRATDEHDHPQA